MELTKTLYVPTREAWRLWLEANHDTETEIWFIFYKKGSGMPSVPYADAVEEALCFGWIDSLMQSLDAEKYAQKFTPRKPSSKWSELNKHRVAKLIREGRMTPAGLAKITFDLEEAHQAPYQTPQKGELPIPPHVEAVLRRVPLAYENLMALSPSERRKYIGWITSAKKEETHLRRAEEAAARLAQGIKLGLK